MARSRNISGEDTAAREAKHVDHSRARAKARTTRLSMGDSDGGDRLGFLRRIVQPSALFCVALAAFLVVSGMKIWEDGWFDPLFAPKGADPIEEGPVRFPERVGLKPKPAVLKPDPNQGTVFENMSVGAQ